MDYNSCIELGIHGPIPPQITGEKRKFLIKHQLIDAEKIQSYHLSTTIKGGSFRQEESKEEQDIKQSQMFSLQSTYKLQRNRVRAKKIKK